MTWRQVSFLVWALVAAALVGAEMLALASGGRYPRINTFFATVTAKPIGRVAIILGWMWLGWHAFAR